jgi:hypothetical protein
VPDALDASIVVQAARGVLGVVGVEYRPHSVDRGRRRQWQPGAPALLDKDPVSYYGTSVRAGYVRQPAFGIVGLEEAHNRYGLTGRNVTVAVIDTGVDPNHLLSRASCFPGTTSRVTATAGRSAAT